MIALGQPRVSAFALAVLLLIVIAIQLIFQMARALRRIVQLTADLRRIDRARCLLRKFSEGTCTPDETAELAKLSEWIDRETERHGLGRTRGTEQGTGSPGVN